MNLFKLSLLFVCLSAAVCCWAKQYSFRGGRAAGVVSRQSGALDGTNIQVRTATSVVDAKKDGERGVIVGKVTKVSDGDTIWVTNAKGKKEKVRLYGIDAPESNQTWGTESKRALYGRIFGKEVTVECKGHDQYGRVIGVVKLGDENLNEWMIAEGHAWWYRHFAKDETAWGEKEKAAREAKKGLWSKAGPINPYEWRKVHR